VESFNPDCRAEKARSRRVLALIADKANPPASRLRIPDMNKRTGRTRTTYLVRDCLHAGRTVRVPVHEIATTVSAWLAELGAHSPLVDDLARAVLAGDWPVALGLSDYLSVDVSIA
jgi:hypothetical protein